MHPTLAPVCSVEFLPLVMGLVPMYSVEFPPLSSLPLQCLVVVWMLCVPAISPVGCPTALASLPDVAASPVSCLTVLALLPNVVTSPVSCLTVLVLLPGVVGSPSVFSFSWLSAMFLHVATRLVIFVIWCH